ncbi:MAG: hypothetical protein ACLTSX_00835 [Collinsella sp.]
MYSLSDIQNITAQLAANSVKDYDKLAEAAGNLNAVMATPRRVLERRHGAPSRGAGKLTWRTGTSSRTPSRAHRASSGAMLGPAPTRNLRNAMEKGEITAAIQRRHVAPASRDAAVEAAEEHLRDLRGSV